ncbi:TPA: hypothetical protein EYG96_02485 [Candidatus Gracilibacteria bacterium]|nr:hypothetical protein [Candidatus Peregrinibacteria bacterium]HIQ56887.1 hypothetical protein [Candidatus Gracilibacteria bacterium]HIQ57555.1 hypothetical protein [Candidatus Gracilibacteria bacterium]
MNKIAIRLCGGTILGALFGLLCFYGFTNNPHLDSSVQIYATWSFSNLIMWDLIANRSAIGFVVGLMGFITIHPLFGFKLPSFLRGFVIGSFISLTLAIGAAMGGNNEPIKTFWILTITGGIIGLIIDVILTKIAGQGADLK